MKYKVETYKYNLNRVFHWGGICTFQLINKSVQWWFWVPTVGTFVKRNFNEIWVDERFDWIKNVSKSYALRQLPRCPRSNSEGFVVAPKTSGFSNLRRTKDFNHYWQLVLNIGYLKKYCIYLCEFFIKIKPDLG